MKSFLKIAANWAVYLNSRCSQFLSEPWMTQFLQRASVIYLVAEMLQSWNEKRMSGRVFVEESESAEEAAILNINQEKSFQIFPAKDESGLWSRKTPSVSLGKENAACLNWKNWDRVWNTFGLSSFLWKSSSNDALIRQKHAGHKRFNAY